MTACAILLGSPALAAATSASSSGSAVLAENLELASIRAQENNLCSFANVLRFLVLGKVAQQIRKAELGRLKGSLEDSPTLIRLDADDSESCRARE